MRTAMITLMATVAMGFAGTLRADEVFLGGETAIAVPSAPTTLVAAATPTTVIAAAPMEDLNVTAQRLPNNAPVAVTGKVAQAGRGMLVIERPDGMVRVRATGDVPDRFGRLQPVTRKVAVGDSVTAYGRIRHGNDRMAINAEALFIPISAHKAELVILDTERLESMAKYNRTLNGKAELRRLNAKHTEL